MPREQHPDSGSESRAVAANPDARDAGGTGPLRGGLTLRSRTATGTARDQGFMRRRHRPIHVGFTGEAAHQRISATARWTCGRCYRSRYRRRARRLASNFRRSCDGGGAWRWSKSHRIDR